MLHWVHTVGEEQVEQPVIPVHTATQFPEVNVYPLLHVPHTLAAEQLWQFVC